MFVLISVLILVIIPVIISIIIIVIIIIIIIIIPISIVLPLSWSISYMGSAWPSWSSVAALRARAALVVSPVMLWILGVNMVNIHMIIPADRAIEIV